MCVISKTPDEWVPCRICTALPVLQKARHTVFVLPTAEQSEMWAAVCSARGEATRMFAALSLLSNKKVSVYGVST